MAQSRTRLIQALADALLALVLDYNQDGGDEEAKTNPSLRKRGQLITKLQKVLDAELKG